MKARTALIFGTFLLGTAYGMMQGIRRQQRRFSFAGRCVVITGGSRGLGLVMARQLARKKARLAIFARDAEELKRAEMQLRRLGAEVLALTCDVRRQEEVNAAIEKVVAHFGTVDVLINNAGVIQVGPLEHMGIRDFQEALATHLYGPLFCTVAVLPHMRLARRGRIVNITSLGGKIAVPHLIPYCASKFALAGLSEGLRTELQRHNILVTTVCPGLMRTGSPRNASFKGRHQREYAWFAIGDSLPLLSVSAERAAEKILTACRRGDARLVIGWPAKVAVLADELFPGISAELLTLANRILPKPAEGFSAETHAGSESESLWSPSWLTRLSEQAALRNNQKPA